MTDSLPGAASPSSRARLFDPAGLIFGVLLPLACAASGVLLTLAWEARLPAELATHWTSTAPDGFSPPMTNAWTFALLIVLVGGGCCVVAAFAQALLLMRRVMLVLGLSVVGLLTAVQVAIVHAHLDLASGADLEPPLSSIGIGVLVGAVIGMLGATLLGDFRTRSRATAPPAKNLPRVADPGVVDDQVGIGLTGSLTVLVLVGVLPGAGVAALAGGWWPFAVFVPLGLLVTALLRFRVIVDAAGVRVVNLGMVSLAYGIGEMVGAEVREVKPFDDFGGWGFKIKGRRNYGVVTRTGPAVVITTASGERLTVTSPRAEEMAGTLNAYADREGRSPDPR
ncbi:DUF1648 domain-containing protein [Rhodococcus triatomae]|uniref:DUF1648 domain-containing protein n=1 Tax=Rhodococcus triatomae TaxID=300028 RepID=A0A1G8SEE5_9NOCA|nr:DUF1648 domain-containing protein [Rhodococcus triatomae]QNG20713.1 DUF1648 domain-containing protein [Rhodococcus triatomae]QNG23369.1 DUF1648 domain-containing protein [Rhodococcus triatomae]SDJ27561.1 hypothetical protein SAMN05444695_12118 [Rhodococcus triatomae]